MAYVLEYTVIGRGVTEIVEATTHQDAVHKFVSEPPLKWGNHPGTYVPEDGEVITVVGPTQEEYREDLWRAHRVASLAEDLAKREGGKRGRKGEPTIAELRQRHAEAVAAKEAGSVQNRIVTFKMRSYTVYAAEYVEGLPERENREGVMETLV